jgi:FtsZ-binding cell division protein ZapB
MFISKAEKTKLIDSVELLQLQVRDLKARVANMERTHKTEEKLHRSMSPENRAKQSERMKKLWADKRIKKENT